MDQEINLDSIRALDEQIREHERTIIKLKRTRNSLLNVSIRLPPEILGRIFRWNVIPDGDFHRLPKASHNFLPVCYHWYQVALGTPELWSFWGNSIQDWGRRHARCRTTPLDLVLSGREGDRLDDTLRDALQDHAAQDIIRQVRLRGAAGLLSSVISSIIAKGEETQSNSARAFILRNTSSSDSVDISNFFSRYNFPKLQCLRLFGFSISSWDLLASRTTSLTTLSLTGIRQSPLPTLSQVLSILSTNPNLQCLELSLGSVPHPDSDRLSSRIQLCCLKTLYLRGSTRRVFGLLSRLELPDKMGNLSLFLSDCLPLDVPQTLGPYLGNYVRRRSPGRLRLSAVPYLNHFYIKAGDVCEGDSTWVNWFMTVEGELGVALAEEEAHKLCFDIIGHIPKEEIVEVTITSLTHSDVQSDLSTP